MMITQSLKIRALAIFIGLSLLLHLFVFASLGRFGNYSFSEPVNPLQTVMVNSEKPSIRTAPVANSHEQDANLEDNLVEDVADDERNHAPVNGGMAPIVVEKSLVDPESIEPADVITRSSETEPVSHQLPSVYRHITYATAIDSPLRTAGEFLTTKSEKLSYLISLLGVPVGNAELEASNENGEIRITLRTRSNAAMSNVYPVDDIMVTRHIAGNFIISKVKQQEGDFRSDIGFTIFLRDKRVFWIDRIRNRYSNETIPNSEVLDTLSSLYYLRNRPLQTGKTELLHIYDGDVYAPVPIEIVREEEIRLRNFKKVDTLLLRHVKQKDGIFRRTGDMLIWLTHDENKVPVKVEATTPFGKVTAELVSSETQQQQHY
jgi:hypothetical protein